MSGPRGEKCRNCYYIVDPDIDAETGFEVGWCVRFPPVERDMQELNRDPGAYAVSVGLDAWCGEFRLMFDPES